MSPASAPPHAPAQPLDFFLTQLDKGVGASRRLRWPRVMVYSAALLFGGLVYWTFWARVDQVVHTQGRIIPSAHQQLVQHLEGGIVSKVYVREGMSVKAGDPLVAVSDLQANSSRGEKAARQAGLAARAARLQAEAEGQSRYTPPSGLDANDPAVRAEADAFVARANKVAQSSKVLEEQAEQRRQEAAEAAVRAKGLRAELEVARAQQTLAQNLVARNAGSQSELLDARSRVERMSTQLAESEAAQPRLAAAAAELRARVSEVKAQFRSEARTALSDTRVELRRMEEDIKTEDDRVRRTVVTAPVAGVVNRLVANTVGGVVKPGETLVELTPEGEAVVIESRATPSERGSLQVGLPTRIKVAAFDYTVYGTLKAKVREISADSLLDERGERYFRVTAVVDPDSVRHFGQALGPGMTVSADMVTGQRTVLQYLLSPVRGLFSNALRDRK